MWVITEQKCKLHAHIVTAVQNEYSANRAVGIILVIHNNNISDSLGNEDPVPEHPGNVGNPN